MVKSVNVCAKTAITASFQIKKSSIGTVKVKVKVKVNDFIRMHYCIPYFVLIRSRTEPIGFASTIINATLETT